jgi:hypothetical protein
MTTKTNPCGEYIKIYGECANDLSFCDGVDAFTRGQQLCVNPYSEVEEQADYETWINGFAAASLLHVPV